MTPVIVPFVAALGIALIATLVCERLASRAGLVKQPREDRWHRHPVPLLGGLAIVAGSLTGLPWAGFGKGQLGSALLVALVMAAVGLVDDVRPLRPPVKLVAEIALAGILIQLGFVLRLTAYPVVNVLVTLFWVVGITNAFNLLDNMDGLAAGMAAVAAGFRLVFFLFDRNPAGIEMTAAFTGALVGFLLRNFPPAKIFMGDAGSLFIGFFLSAMALGQGSKYYSRGVFAVLVLPVLLVLIPIFDTTFVTVTRLVSGRPVSQGGRDHTSHRLVQLGISERRALAVLYGVSIAAGLVAVLSYQYGFTYTIVLLTLLLVGLALLGIHLSRVQVVRADQIRPDATIVRLFEDMPFKRHVSTVTIDLILIVVAYYSAYLLRFEDNFEVHRGAFVWSVAPVLVIQLLALTVSGAYRGIWRYTSVPELVQLLRGISLGSAASVVYFVLAERFNLLSRAVFVLDWLLLIVLICGSRVSFRLLSELLRRPPESFHPVLIYGAGDGGELMLRELRNNPELRRQPVGFVDDDRSKIGTRIHEVPVLGGLEALDELLSQKGVSEVVVSSHKITAERLRRLETVCAAHGIRIVRASVRIE